MSNKYLIWWTTQADCESLPTIDSWPTWLAAEYRDRHGRPGRGRLWVSAKFGRDPEMPDEAKWDSSKWTCQAADSCGGIVIPRDALQYVEFLPGFITTFDMEIPIR